MNKITKENIKGLIVGIVPLVIVFLIALLIISPVKAEQQSLGVFKQNNCVKLLQTCANCTYVNFTAVYQPDMTLVLTNQNATKTNSMFYYDFCNTSINGNYLVNGIGDVDGVNTVFSYDFEINQAGRETSPQTTMAVIIAISVVAFLFFFFAFNLSQEHYLLKILLIFFGLTTIVLIPAVLINGDYSVSTVFLNIPTWFFRIFVIYFIVYLVWDWAKSSEKIMSIFRRS